MIHKKYINMWWFFVWFNLFITYLNMLTKFFMQNKFLHLKKFQIIKKYIIWFDIAMMIWLIVKYNLLEC